MENAKREPIPRLSFTRAEFCAATGIPHTRFYELIAAGKLRTFKVGKRRMVTAEAARSFLEAAEREGGVA